MGGEGASSGWRPLTLNQFSAAQQVWGVGGGGGGCHQQPRHHPSTLSATLAGPCSQGALLETVSALLDANATSACGVALLLHFPRLRPHFDLAAVVEDLVVSQQHPVALRLLGALGRDARVAYVACCLQYSQLRRWVESSRVESSRVLSPKEALHTLPWRGKVACPSPLPS